MSLFLDVLGSMGVGGQIMTAATLGVIAIYALKAKSGAGTVAAVLSSSVGYVVVVLGAAAVSIALGWVDPDPGTLMTHAQAVVDFVWSISGGWVMDWLSEVLP